MIFGSSVHRSDDYPMNNSNGEVKNENGIV